MKKILSLLLALIMVIALVPVNGAMEIYFDNEWHEYIGNVFKLKVNDELLNCEVPPIVFNDYSVVPARDVFEKLGAKVDWTPINQKVTVNYGDTKIEVHINNKTAKKNGKKEIMPIPAKLINGKTMIPVRYVGESLGFLVDFDNKTDTVIIEGEKKSEQKPVTTPTPAPAPTPTPAPTYGTTLNSYTYSTKADTFTATFNFSKAVKYSHFALKEPSRIVIDTEDTKQGATIKNTDNTKNEDVTGIRIGQQPAGIRIVIDLAEDLKYTVTSSGKKLVVKIGTVASIKPAPEEEEEEKEDTKTEPDEEEEENEEIQKPVIPQPPSYAPTRTVCLDPGHGGEDPGAIHTDPDGTIWRESEINLGVAMMVKEILEDNNVKVIMTRESDKTVELTTRGPFANSKQTALFVSIHTNSFMGEAANGIETWGTLYNSATYSGVTDKNLADNIQSAVIKKTGAVNRGVKDTSTLAVIRTTIMPSVLIEVGFISNPAERELMFTDSYRRKLAEGIAEGILKTFDQMGL